MKHENLIIGGGLTGTILAWQFYFNNKNFLLIDDNPQNSSSKVAAGLYNPIVFKRLTLSWLADKLIHYLDDFYSKIESVLNIKFHFKRNILRIIPSKEDQDFWIKRTKLDQISKYTINDIFDNPFTNIINAPYGMGVVKNAGNINTNLFLEESKKFFIKNNSYLNIRVEINKNNLDDLILKHKSERIIFAEGWLNTNNIFFSWLPYKLVKGEILKLKINGLDTFDVPNKRVFLLPLGNFEFIAGSTYRWTFSDDKPTNEEKNYLIDHLDNILKAKYEIIDHKAGIRPAILDRRPVIGKHPKINNYYIFNGMGSKSVMLSPFLSKNLFDHIYKNKEIENEASIKRYLKYFI